MNKERATSGLSQGSSRYNRPELHPFCFRGESFDIKARPVPIYLWSNIYTWKRKRKWTITVCRLYISFFPRCLVCCIPTCAITTKASAKFTELCRIIAPSLRVGAISNKALRLSSVWSARGKTMFQDQPEIEFILGRCCCYPGTRCGNGISIRNNQGGSFTASLTLPTTWGPHLISSTAQCHNKIFFSTFEVLYLHPIL